MIRAGAERTVVVREWVVEATEAIDLLEKLPMLLRDTRAAKGLSLRELAKELSVSASTLDRVEQEIGAPSIENAIAILRWLTKVTNA